MNNKLQGLQRIAASDGMPWRVRFSCMLRLETRM